MSDTLRPQDAAAADWRMTHFCGRQQCHRPGDFDEVVFYALGEKFLVDAGCGECVLLDEERTDEFDTTLGDAASCAEAEGGARRALRRMILVRAGPAPYLAILDVNEKEGRPFAAEVLWRTDAGNRISLDADGRFVIRGVENICAAEVLWPRAPAPALALAESRGGPQVSLSLTAPVVETLAVFCPRRAREPRPRFSCRRDGRAAFSVTCDLAGSASVLRCSAATDRPLSAPKPVRLQSR